MDEENNKVDRDHDRDILIESDYCSEDAYGVDSDDIYNTNYNTEIQY